MLRQEQNTYHRKNKKNTIPDALISYRDRKYQGRTHTKKDTQEKTEQDKKRDRKNKVANFARHQTGSWGFAKACESEYRKRHKFKESAEPEETEESDTGKSKKILSETELVTDRRNHITITKIDGTKKNTVDTESSLIEKPPDKKHKQRNEIIAKNK